MNKRINELADKVWAKEYWDDPKTDKLLLMQLNKFAELVVQDCVDACRSRAAGAVGTHASAHNNAIGACISAIQQQFGEELTEQDPLRADFEKWLPKKSDRYSTERYGPVYGNMKDMYVSALTEELWLAWQSHFKQQGETK